MGTNIIEESGLKFSFAENCETVKFDDTRFYRDYFNKFTGSKGVDFIFANENRIAFIEVKNCTGDESNCRWRITPNNKKKDATYTSVNVEGRDSLDTEMVQKIAMTIAALIGAKSFEKDCVKELEPFSRFLSSEDFSGSSKERIVILFLEGKFGSKTRSKKMIMGNLQKSINKKLKWIKCKVSVVDSDTYNAKIFEVGC